MNVAEIFHSIQGEGKNQGYPCTFLRLAGCNLACTWCDTPQARSGGVDMSRGEIIRRIAAFAKRYVCITGGEPLLQANQLLPLVRYLSETGYTLEIETNGTVDFRTFQPYASICMDVKCPSSHAESDLLLLPFIREEDGVKFVVSGIPDCEYAVTILHDHPVRGEIFFSPVYGSDYRKIADFVMGLDHPVRLQLQLHKIIGVE